MKKIILISLLFSIYGNADLSVKAIQDMIVTIHKKRSGIKLKTLDSTKEPFVRLEQKNNATVVVIPDKKKTINKDVTLILHSILNQKAYINKSWVKVDDIILGYKLMFIGKRGVVLRNENNIRKLFLRNENNIRKLFLRKQEKNSLIHLKKR